MTDLLEEPTPAAGGTPAARPGAALPPGLREEVFRMIAVFSDDYADVLARYCEGLSLPGQIAATGAAGGDPAAAGRALLRIRFMLGDPVTTAPRRAGKVAGTVRSVAGQPGASPAVREWLGGVVDRLETLAKTGGTARRGERAPRPTRTRLWPAAAADEALEYARSGSCVYVYTFLMYWQHPDENGRRMLKVGMTTRDAPARVLGQARLTASPEDPLILRVYPTDDPAAVERTFHQLLRSAGHVGPPTRSGGTEWFPTTLEYLDSVALALGLQTTRGTPPS